MTIIYSEKESDIVIGLAIVPRDEGKNRWALPNRKHTTSKKTATEFAKRIDKILQANKGVEK